MTEEKRDENIEEELETFDAEVVDEVKEEAQVADDELLRLRDGMARLQADFANLRARTEKEKANIYKYASESLVTKLLPVLDNLDRALLNADMEDSFVKGIKLVSDDLQKTLASEGLVEIKSDGEKFDANFHHAVFMEENDHVESGYIIETFQKGYLIGDKVIRPAMVKVSK